jgi:hypothetical protein
MWIITGAEAMKSHPQNRNLTLTYASHWRGLPLLAKHTPYVCEYLDRILETLEGASRTFPRLLVARFDLHFPLDLEVPRAHAISRFIKRLQREVDVYLNGRGSRYHCDIGHAWAAERDLSSRQHYHVVIFANKDAFHTWGRFPRENCGTTSPTPEQGLAHCIVRAWGHALLQDPCAIAGTVHFAEKGIYWLNRNKASYTSDFEDIYRRSSYLAKAETKEYGCGYRCFGYAHKFSGIRVTD